MAPFLVTALIQEFTQCDLSRTKDTPIRKLPVRNPVSWSLDL